MGVKTSISWTDSSWSPFRSKVNLDAGEIAKAKGYTSLIKIAEKMAGHIGPHCERISPGCGDGTGGGCYSEAGNHRCLPANGTGLPFDRRARDLITPFVDLHILKQPIHWKASRMIFVNSQTDTWGEWIPFEDIDLLFAVAVLCPRHTLQFLTKRADRMLEWAQRDNLPELIDAAIVRLGFNSRPEFQWPLPNVWMGFSAEDQLRFDERWKSVRSMSEEGWTTFCSYEPALGHVDASGALTEGLNWLICGGESGANSRPFNIAWALDVIAQCKAASRPCFVKQLGRKPIYTSGFDSIKWPADMRWHVRNGSTHLRLKDGKGGDWNEWEPNLRVREFPTVPNV